LGGIQQYCREAGIVFIADEIQCGLGRTGRWFASEHFGLVPDLVVTGKALGGGLPLAGVTGRTELMDTLSVGSLGSTFGGNPVACAASLATLDQMKAEDLVSRAEHLGRLLTGRLTRMLEKYEVVGDVRGLGAMVAVELVKDRRTKLPAADLCADVFESCWRAGVIVLRTGPNVVRLLPPLTISLDVLMDGLDVLDNAVAQADRLAKV
jgi:4-aminobutyrate aminotransferase/(S)-3-amino-2-methylpropionate transaminase